jgi:hypothetical protein
MSKDSENFSKDIADMKKLVKSLDMRARSLEDKVDQILLLMNTITFLVSESDSDADLEEEEDEEEWNPYRIENEFDQNNDSDDSSEY